MSRARAPVGWLIAWSAVGVAVLVTTWSLPIDDFWLTLASGRAIAQGANPAVALPFSWTETAQDALNPQWGAQVILGGHGSLALALALNAALIAGALLLTVVRASTRASGIAVATAMLLVLAALSPHLLARAQSFSLTLFSAALLLLEWRAARRWLPIAYAVLMVLWANLHGAFVIGQVVALLFAADAVIRRVDRMPLVATAIVALVAPILNPAGLDLIAYAYTQPAIEVVRAISVEWQPSWPWVPLTLPFWFVVALIVVGRVRGGPHVSLVEAATLLALGLLAASSIRHTPWFLLAAAPLLAADISRVRDRSRGIARALPDLPPGLRNGKRRAVFGALVLLAIGVQLIRPSMPPGIARLTPDEPAVIVDTLSDMTAPGDRILNEQVWGGYLAYRLWPEVETAMDGRLEIRTRDTWAEYFALMQGRLDAPSVLAADGVGWALIAEDRQALIRQLIGAGWIEVEREPGRVLLSGPAEAS